MTKQYEVVAYRDGKWWTFEIPALTASPPAGGGRRIVAMGQARTTSEIADEARDIAAMWTDTDEENISVQVTYRLPEGVREAVDQAQELDAAGREALEKAAVLRRSAVRLLRTEGGLSQADSAAVLGLSRQRVQQLDSARA